MRGSRWGTAQAAPRRPRVCRDAGNQTRSTVRACVGPTACREAEQVLRVCGHCPHSLLRCSGTWGTCFGLEGSRIPGVWPREALPAVRTASTAGPRSAVWKGPGWTQGLVNLSVRPSDTRRGGAWRRREQEEVARVLCCPTVSPSVHTSAFRKDTPARRTRVTLCSRGAVTRSPPFFVSPVHLRNKALPVPEVQPALGWPPAEAP